MCEKYLDKISMYVDELLYEDEVVELKKHLEICKECNEYYKFLCDMKKEINNFNEIELPEDFHNNCMNGLKLELAKSNKIIKINFKKHFTYVASVIIMIFIVSPTINYINNYKYEANENIEINLMNAEQRSEESFEMNATDSRALTRTNMKLNIQKMEIKNIDIDINITQEEFDDLNNEILNNNNFDIVTSGSSNKNSYYNIKYDETVFNVFDNYKNYDILNYSEHVEDVTNQVLQLQVLIDENNSKIAEYKNFLNEINTFEEINFVLENINSLENENVSLINSLNDYKSRAENTNLFINIHENHNANNSVFKTFFTSFDFINNILMQLLNLIIIILPLAIFIGIIAFIIYTIKNKGGRI